MYKFTLDKEENWDRTKMIVGGQKIKIKIKR